MHWLTYVTTGTLAICVGCDETSGGSTPDALTVLDAGALDGAPTDAAPAVDAAPPTCRLDAPERVIVLEGGIATVEVVAEGVEAVDVDHAGLTAARLVDGRLELKASYGPPGTSSGVLRAQCPGGAVDVPFEIERQALRFEPIAAWDDEGPPAREYFSMWIDPLDPDALWIFGGFHYRPQQFTVGADTWRFDLVDETWSPVETNAPPMRAGGGLAFVPDSRTALYYGGLARTDNGFSLPYAFARLDHTGDTATWTPIEAPVGGRGTYQPGFVHDPVRERFLTFGGQGVLGTHMRVSAIDYDATVWERLELHPAPGPTGRTGFFWAYDPPRDRIVLFGGEQGGDADGGCDCAGDTWGLDLAQTPPRWRQLADDGPEGRRNGLYAYDPFGERLLIWGGTPDGMTSSPDLWAFDLRTDAWHRLNVGDTAPVRASGGAVVDYARGRLVLGFGNSTAGIFQDLWAIPLVPSLD